MRIAFVSTQSSKGSTLIGRTIPIAEHLAAKHDVHLLAFSPLPVSPVLKFHPCGRDPFIRTPDGKIRLRSVALLANMLASAFKFSWRLFRISPDVVVIVKTLPHNVLGVRLWSVFYPRRQIIVDVDDFELTANHLTSLWQRAAIHWAQRVAARLSDTVVTATPFLSDYFLNLRPQVKVKLIPTGIHPLVAPPDCSSPNIAYFGSTSISSGHRVDFLPAMMADIIKIHPRAKLYIAGSGDDNLHLKELFAALGLSSSVVWHGRFSLADLPSLLNNVSVLVDPIDTSIANRAKSSFRVELAVSVGRPVVTSNVGLRPWLIPAAYHHRFFADPYPAALAVRVIDLLSHPLASSSRRDLILHSHRFHWSALAAAYQSIIDA